MIPLNSYRADHMSPVLKAYISYRLKKIKEMNVSIIYYLPGGFLAAAPPLGPNMKP